MNLKYTLFLSLLLFLSCSLKEQVYENQYLKLVLPDGWMITEKDNSENSRWLVSTSIPADSKYYNDTLTEAPVQNFIVVAVDSEVLKTKQESAEFNEYRSGLYNRQKQRGFQVSKMDTVDLRGRKAYHWLSTIQREGKEPLIQEYYMTQLQQFYLTFLLTHSVRGKITGSNKILSSVVFKK